MLLRREGSARLPKGTTVTFDVRYQGGRKTFASHPDAREFARTQRDSVENGWAELSRVTTEIVEAKS